MTGMCERFTHPCLPLFVFRFPNVRAQLFVIRGEPAPERHGLEVASHKAVCGVTRRGDFSAAEGGDILIAHHRAVEFHQAHFDLHLVVKAHGLLVFGVGVYVGDKNARFLFKFIGHRNAFTGHRPVFLEYEN